ncbi:MAG: response regulator [Bacteroidetes bacterium]|jgi:two-component system LytT family response regulator|nr:response regulator [Bacteroidota bacterium]
MKTCIVVDDEKSSRQLIREYLEDYPGFKIIDEAENGKQAVRKINATKPDVVFLDIQMPVMTGFEMLPHLDEYPHIIFSTAYDNYAIKAFEVHAVDYLLKPYTKNRFAKAIEKLSNSRRFEKQMQFIDESISKQTTYPKSILVERSSRFFNIKTSDITKIEAYGDYSKIFTKNQYYLSKNGLSKLEDKLNPEHFMRIHRSTLINKQALVSLSKLGKGFIAQLSDGSEVKVSKGYAKQVKDMIY